MKKKFQNKSFVSILINNYNYGNFIEDCLKSCLDQSYDNYEIIVYDDQSTDNSLKVLTKFKNQIKMICGHGEKNKFNSFNQAKAINEAFIKSNGDIICLLDSDDMFLPLKIERVVEHFNSNPEAVLVQHPFYEINELGHFTGTVRPEFKKVNIKKYIYKSFNLTGLFSQTSGLSFRRSYLNEVLPIKQDNYNLIWPDVRLTRQSIFYGKIITDYAPLGCYRNHGFNDSLKLNNKDYMEKFIKQLYQYFNRTSQKHNYEKIELKESIVNPDYSTIEFFIKVLLTNREPLSVKSNIFGSLIKKYLYVKRN